MIWPNARSSQLDQLPIKWVKAGVLASKFFMYRLIDCRSSFAGLLASKFFKRSRAGVFDCNRIHRFIAFYGH